MHCPAPKRNLVQASVKVVLQCQTQPPPNPTGCKSIILVHNFQSLPVAINSYLALKTCEYSTATTFKIIR